MKLAGIILFCVAACAQNAKPAEFEVATVKPSKGSVDRLSAGVHVDGAQVHIADLSLRDYVRIAYRIKLYQVIGADSLSERFNVDAKIPDGATRNEVPDMLQALLAERFEMKMHREKKEFPVYALTVAAGGIKLKESAPEEEDATAANTTSVAASGSQRGVSLNLGHGSSFTFADNKLSATKLTMAVFADTLARFVDRPVVDHTGIGGRYDIALELTPEDYQVMLIQSAVTAGVQLPPQALQLLEGARNDSLNSGLRKLGLEMSPAKAPLEVVVVDHIAKAPAEN